MGANATTFVPSYTSGEVLTAANLSVTNSGIPVFANSTARTAAFGGTGEKTLAEGQYAYLESDNSTSFYDGAAWQTIGGGMTLLSTTTLSGATTAVTGISQDYISLFITVEKFQSSSDAYLNAYLNADSTSGNYKGTCIRARVGVAGAISDSNYEISGFASDAAANNSLIAVTIPNYTNTIYKTWLSYGMQTTDNAANGTFNMSGAYFGATTAISSITFAPSAGTFSAGTVKIYGVK